MWALTEDQKALAAEYFYIAKITAKHMECVRDPDRSLSASCLGLCYAAHKWIPDIGRKTFRNYAIWACRKAIICEFRRDNRDKRNMRMNDHHYPYMAMTNATNWDLEHAYEQRTLFDENPELKQWAHVSGALKKLAPQERLAMEMTLKGMRQCEIERKMGWGRHVAGAALYRGIAKLKKAFGK